MNDIFGPEAAHEFCNASEKEGSIPFSCSDPQKLVLGATVGGLHLSDADLAVLH